MSRFFVACALAQCLHKGYRLIYRALYLVLACATATSLVAGELRHEQTEDGSHVAWYSPPKPGEAGLTAIARYEPDRQRPSLYILQLSFAGGAHRFADCKRAFWRVDGQPAPQIATHYSQRTTGAVHLELFTGQLSREQLQRLASATTVEVQLCTEKVAVAADDLNGLKQVLAATRG
ncbi:hypothetical protein [Pseudomonas sp. LRF_L74]|uniref:hypothetical protein n=1 Tax=Pseudomonas sp. LRF_L74 TaxID=3369422 RepID=UPI003F60CB45